MVDYYILLVCCVISFFVGWSFHLAVDMYLTGKAMEKIGERKRL